MDWIRRVGEVGDIDDPGGGALCDAAAVITDDVDCVRAWPRAGDAAARGPPGDVGKPSDEDGRPFSGDGRRVVPGAGTGEGADGPSRCVRDDDGGFAALDAAVGVGVARETDGSGSGRRKRADVPFVAGGGRGRAAADGIARVGFGGRRMGEVFPGADKDDGSRVGSIRVVVVVVVDVVDAIAGAVDDAPGRPVACGRRRDRVRARPVVAVVVLCLCCADGCGNGISNDGDGMNESRTNRPFSREAAMALLYPRLQEDGLCKKWTNEVTPCLVLAHFMHRRCDKISPLQLGPLTLYRSALCLPGTNKTSSRY